MAPAGRLVVERPAEGVTLLRIERRERRGALFAEFRELWTDLRREGFRARLEFAITERPLGTTVGTP